MDGVKKPKVKPPLEREIQKQIVQYLKAAGWSVWQTSQGHKHPTGAKGLRITPGIPDLYAIHRKHGAIWVEVKRPGGTFSEAQNIFSTAHLFLHQPLVLWVHSLDELRKELE